MGCSLQLPNGAVGGLFLEVAQNKHNTRQIMSASKDYFLHRAKK